MITTLSNILRAGCLVALGAIVSWQGASAKPAEQKGPILVELFTSQGCSSCPPADQILADLQKRSDVVALSMNIDYWDYVGWRDTLATRANTLRQQAYEKVLPSHRVYTPQMVIDGAGDVVGNQRKEVLQAVERRVKETRGKRVPVSVKQVGDEVHVQIGAMSGAQQPATVWLAHTLSSRTVNIGKGENTGRVITYHNIVRSFAAVGKWTGEPVTLELPARGTQGEITDGVAVWVQTNGNGPIIGAAQTRLR